VLAGAGPVLVFPPIDWGWLTWVVLVPMLLVVRAAATWREAALRGWLAGFGFLTAAHYWLVPNLVFFFPLVMAGLAVLWLPWAILAWGLLRPPLTVVRASAALAGVPAGWVLIEVARSWQWLGGPWALLGAGQWRHPTELGLAAVGGPWLVTFAIVAANTGVVLLISGPPPVRAAGAVAALAAVTAGPAWYFAHPGPPASRSLRVALVQPGLTPGPAARLAEQMRQSGRLAGSRLDLVVWGESSVGYDLPSHPSVLDGLRGLSATLHADVLVNIDARNPSGQITKTSVLVVPDGIAGSYQKTRLVPFGEYIPFRSTLGWLTGLTRAAGQNRQPGTGPVILHISGGQAIGPLISFESLFPDMARTDAAHGAQLIVYQEALSTFQDSWAPDQQASFVALRAAETGRPVVQAALTGVSVAYDSRGRRLARLGTHDHGAVTVTVPLAAATTPYDRFGNYLPVLCLPATVLIATALALSRMRGPGPGGTRSDLT
jgi:apolipoprotein N-acyltransferase